MILAAPRLDACTASPSSSVREHRSLRRHRLRSAREILRRPPDADRPRAGHRPRSLLCAVGGVRLRKGTSRREAHLLLPLQVARDAANKVRPGGTLLFMGGTGAATRRRGSASSRRSRPRFRPNEEPRARARALRVNLIAAGFVDTPLSASLLGDQLDARREQLRKDAADQARRRPGRHRRPRRPPHDNTAVTGATYDIDGGQQLVEG